jgi:hypothetical protein
LIRRARARGDGPHPRRRAQHCDHHAARHGQSGRVWLTFNGAIKTTVVMTNPETMQLCELLNKATAARTSE